MAIRSRALVFSISFAFLYGVVPAVADDSLPISWSNSYIVDAPPSGVELGMGWNRYSESLVPSRCILFAPVQEGGQTSSLRLAEVSDSSELAKHLGVSASASIKGLAYSASGSAAFVQDSTVKTSSQSFALHASVTNGALFVGPYTPPAPRRFSLSSTQVSGAVIPIPANKTSSAVGLSPWVFQEFGEGEAFNPKQFEQYCGTGFVSAIYSGAELFHVTTITTSISETSRKVEASVRGSYGVGAASADAKMDDSALFERANTQMSFFQWGGSSGDIPASREQVISKLQTLAREAADAPKFYDIQLTPYSDLPNYPKSAVPDNQNHKEIIVRRFLQLQSLDNDLHAVIDFLREPTTKQESGAPNDPTKPDPVVFERCFPLEYYENMQDSVRTLLSIIEKAQQDTAKNNWDYSSFTASESAIRQLGLAPVAPDVIPPTVFNDSVKENWFLIWLAKQLSMARLRGLLPPLVDISASPLCDTKKTPSPTDRDKYRERVLAQYIRPVNDRVCRESFDDIDCMTNREISTLAQYIPFVPNLQDMKSKNIFGYMCSAHATPLRRCVARTKTGNVGMTTDLSKAALLQLQHHDGGTLLVQQTFDGDGTPELVLSFGGQGPRLSKRHSYYVTGKAAGDPTNLVFDIGLRDGKEKLVFRLAPRRPDPEKLGKLCLLDEEQAELYLWPREKCNSNDTAGYTRDAYSWLFFTQDLYTPPDGGA